MWESFEQYLNIKFKKLLKLPFIYWRSYKYGIINEKGQLLKDLDKLSPTEKQFHNVFTELVRKLKLLVLTYVPSGKGLMRYKIYDDWMKDDSNLNKVVKECCLHRNSDILVLENQDDKIKEMFLEWLNENKN